MNWGNGIIFSFVLFAIFIAILVTVCVRQDISLVSSDYYQEELKYQDQITRINNTSKLDTQPVIKIVQNNYTPGDWLFIRPACAHGYLKFCINYTVRCRNNDFESTRHLVPA